MRTILLVNKSSLIDRDAFGRYAAAQQRQVTEHFGPVYGLDVQLQVAADHKPNEEAVVFCDHPDQADALGYHELVQSSETPLGFVFPGLGAKYSTPWESIGSHETLEQIKDPYCNRAAVGIWARRPAIIADEPADPCQNDLYAIDDVPMSNFVTPAWFDATNTGAGFYDLLGLVKTPCTLRPGGYISVSFDLKHWHQVFAWKHPMTGYRFHPGVDRYKRVKRRGKTGPHFIQRPKK